MRTFHVNERRVNERNERKGNKPGKIKTTRYKNYTSHGNLYMLHFCLLCNVICPSPMIRQYLFASLCRHLLSLGEDQEIDSEMIFCHELNPTGGYVRSEEAMPLSLFLQKFLPNVRNLSSINFNKTLIEINFVA